MKHHNLTKRLKRYGRRTQAVRGEHREENVLKIMEMERGKQEFVRFPIFVREQIGMVGKYTLLWYVTWLVLFVWVLKGDGMNGLGGHTKEILLSILPPFLLLLTVQDISRVFSDSMLELEKTTKFSPEHVVMVHFLTMSLTHGFLLLVGILLTQNALDFGLQELVIYGYTPLTLTAAVFLEMTRHLRGEKLRLAGASAVGGIIFLLVFTGTEVFWPLKMWNLYSPDMLTVWEVALAVGTLFCVLEMLWIMRKEWMGHGTGNKRYIKSI